MSDTRTPIKTDLRARPPIPPRPKSALKNKIMTSTPKPTHKRTKSDPSPSPSKKQQEKRVRIDALSPAKNGQIQRSLKVEIGEDSKSGIDTFFSSPSPRTPKPKNVPSRIANNRPLSFSGRVAALLVAYDAYGYDPSSANLQQYEEELISFGFSCPQNPIRGSEGEEEWQKRLDQHKKELSDHSEYYSLHSNVLQKAKGQKNIEQKLNVEACVASPSPQKISPDKTIAQPLPSTVVIPPQASQQKSPVAALAETKTQTSGDLFFHAPQAVSDRHSINRVTPSKQKISFPKIQKSTGGGFWSFCPCGKAEEEAADDMGYSQLPGEPAAKQRK